MAMGRRDQQGQQEKFWIAHTELPRTVAHPFYEQVNRLLVNHEFDRFAERECAPFYASKMGRPSLAPGSYFRLLLHRNAFAFVVGVECGCVADYAAR